MEAQIKEGGSNFVGKIDKMESFIDRSGSELEGECHFSYMYPTQGYLMTLFHQSKM